MAFQVAIDFAGEHFRTANGEFEAFGQVVLLHRTGDLFFGPAGGPIDAYFAALTASAVVSRTKARFRVKSSSKRSQSTLPPVAGRQIHFSVQWSGHSACNALKALKQLRTRLGVVMNRKQVSHLGMFPAVIVDDGTIGGQPARPRDHPLAVLCGLLRIGRIQNTFGSRSTLRPTHRAAKTAASACTLSGTVPAIGNE